MEVTHFESNAVLTERSQAQGGLSKRNGDCESARDTNTNESDSDSDSHFLDRDRVFLIMEALQEEQKKSAALIVAMNHEHKKAVNLKKGIVALGIFAVLLAIANIGTSFAAAVMAKDYKVSISNDLVSLSTDERLGTTAKIVTLSIYPVFEQERRKLQDLAFMFCQKLHLTDESLCYLGGQMHKSEAEKLHQQFCPDYPGSTECAIGGVEKVILNCNGKRSIIRGGEDLPPTGPSQLELEDISYTVFPTLSQGYATQQRFYTDYGALPCKVDMTVSIYCPDDGSYCAIMGYMDSLPTCTDEQVVALCADTRP
jgi:hypothetical protein